MVYFSAYVSKHPKVDALKWCIYLINKKVDVLWYIYFFILSKPSSCARNIFRIGRRCHSLTLLQG